MFCSRALSCVVFWSNLDFNCLKNINFISVVCWSIFKEFYSIQAQYHLTLAMFGFVGKNCKTINLKKFHVCVLCGPSQWNIIFEIPLFADSLMSDIDWKLSVSLWMTQFRLYRPVYTFYLSPTSQFWPLLVKCFQATKF